MKKGNDGTSYLNLKNSNIKPLPTKRGFLFPLYNKKNSGKILWKIGVFIYKLKIL